MQLPIVTEGISSSEPQVLSQQHTQACIATSVCMGNIQNIQILKQILNGKGLVHTNVQGHFGMVEQYRKLANHNSTVRNVHVLLSYSF